MANSFQKAKKSSVYLKLAITGPSGSGKTTAALKMARGLVGKKGKIALIDTEGHFREMKLKSLFLNLKLHQIIKIQIR